MNQRSQERSEEDDTEDAGELSKQVRFEVLSARRRRQALRHLFELGGEASLRELSERIAAQENDVPLAEVTYKQRTRVYTALRQNHLPKLDDEGVVDFDVRSGDTKLRSAAEDLRPYLYEEESETDAAESGRPRFAVLALAFGAVVVVGLGAGVQPLVSLPTLAWFAGFLALFGVALAADTR